MRFMIDITLKRYNRSLSEVFEHEGEARRQFALAQHAFKEGKGVIQLFCTSVRVADVESIQLYEIDDEDDNTQPAAANVPAPATAAEAPTTVAAAVAEVPAFLRT